MTDEQLFSTIRALGYTTWAQTWQIVELISDIARDAERYRALRDSLDPSKRTTLEMPRVCAPLDCGLTYTPEGLDAAIDKAIEIMKEQA